MRTKGRALLTLLLLVLVAVPVAAALLSESGTAQACSIGVTDYPRGALREVANTRILLVGTVVSERSMPRPPNTQPAWESVVVANAVIKGEVPDEPLVIPYIGFLGGDCSGGPRLREGETVMIPVFRGRLSYGNGEEGWRLHGIFSKVLLEDGQATLQWADGSEPLGDAEAVIRAYGLAVGADAEQIEAAIAPVSSSGSAIDDADGVQVGVVAVGVVVAVVAGCLAIWRVRRRADSQA